MHLTSREIVSRRPCVLKSELAPSLWLHRRQLSLHSLPLASLRACRERRRRLRDAAVGALGRENNRIPDPAASSGSRLRQVDAVGRIDFSGRVSASVRESREERRPERCRYGHSRWI